LEIGIVALGGEEKCAIDEGVLVVDGKGLRTDDATHFRHLVRGEVGEDETTSLIVAMGALIFHFDVVGVLLVPGQEVKYRIVRPSSEDIACCCLFLC